MIDFTVFGFSEESSSQLNRYYDFTRCVRPDGTAYGTGGKCRKGTEEAKAEVSTKERVSKEKAIKPAGAPKRGRPKKVAATTEQAPKAKTKEAKPKKEVEIKPISKGQTKPSKLTDEKLKEVFGRAVAAEKEAVREVEKLRRLGGSWDDPELASAYARVARRRDAVSLLRETYHARDRDAFVKASGEISKIRKKSDEMREEAIREAKKQGLSEYTLPKDHPLKKKLDEAENIRMTANGEPRDRQLAAYFGEPQKASKLVSDGGGEVSPSVPSSLPRGGASKKLKEFLDGSEVVMAFQVSGFSKFVKEGEAKNGFESGTQGIKKGRVRSYLEVRTRGEKAVLDIPEGTDPKGRPVYAALEHPDRSRSLQGGSGNQMAQYGGIQVVLNSSVKDRATFTVGDSLDYNSGRSIKASPVRDPSNPKVVNSVGSKEVDLKIGGQSSNDMRIFNARTDIGPSRPSYVEAQIHGGLRSSDIKEVRYYRGHEIPPATRKLLEKQGVKIVELPPRMRDLRVDRDNPNYGDITAMEID